MIVYYVTERITKTSEEIACGIYSSLERAHQAILQRVSEDYSPEEMKEFKFSEDGTSYETFENEWFYGSTFEIDRILVDKDLG